ncbi:M57 family metalloprotease [Chitinophaga barathri]|uniref:Protease n=1 Tax=Chitinophaga barathri TaxID=1647451 RepID=A0A3N4M8H5_9BACT|nr:M57 family metalloprotease [Chitinophaga barathri]RPD39678.1 protease [Chitinophaga barathri]
MKKQTSSILSILFLAVFVTLAACQKESKPEAPAQGEVSQQVLDQIKAKGFSTAGVRAYNGGYIVENDIFLDQENLSAESTTPNVRIAEVEQYRTNNLVRNLPRVIRVKVVNLGTAFVQGTDLAIQRYNALGLSITFQRVTSGTANITIQGFYEGPSGGFITLGYAGFPTSSGNPYNSISMNTHPQAYGSNPNVNYVGSVIQHEIGHCIGFRHTDYMNRAYSCGSGGNEGSAGVGAVRIPGTPSGPDAASWMLACSNGGNRTFNANDRIALNYLY